MLRASIAKVVAFMSLMVVIIVALFYTKVAYINDREVLGEIAALRSEVEYYKQKLRSFNDVTTGGHGNSMKLRLFERAIPSSRSLDRNYKTDQASLVAFTKSVTVLVYSNAGSSNCLISQIRNIRKVLGDIEIIIASSDSIVLPANNIDKKIKVLKEQLTEGKALNSMISFTATEFFLYLSEGATLSAFNTNNGPGWLLHAMKSIPELDFVGGAYLWYNSTLPYKQYETQCYRLKMCSWVFSQTFEYKYSLGDMMICEETSTSFMGRKASVSKVGTFDPKLQSMATTEFFWRAKDKANVGLRPEVFFVVEKVCSKRHLAPERQSALKKSFMDKYDLRVVKDSYGRVTPYPIGQTVSGGFNHYKDGGIMTPVAYKMMERMLFIGDDFCKTHNLTYFLDAGVVLGATKMRAILPWDGPGDIDSGYYGMKWQDFKRKLQKFCPDCSFSTGATGFGPPGLQHVDIRLPNGEGIFNEFYTHEFELAPPPEDMLYVFVNGRDIPVQKDFLAVHRQSYGLNYLITLRRSGKVIECKKPGHHACLPKAFAEGGGNWRDFYCD